MSSTSSVQVILESPDNTSLHLHEQALRRIRQSMRSVSWLVLRAKVRLSGAGGDTDPFGGISHAGRIDKRCEVELTTETGESIVVASLARDWNSALHSALSRASKSLLHRWQAQQGLLAQRRLVAVR